MQVARPEDHRSEGLDQGSGHRESADGDPDGRGHLSSPTSAHSDAATIGSPAGATVVSTSATATPSSATTLARGLRNSGTISPRKKAGRIASRPSALGFPMMAPPNAPRIVPITQAGYWTSVAPSRKSTSNRP